MIFWHLFLWLALGTASIGLALAIKKQRVSKAAAAWLVLATLLALAGHWAYLNGVAGQLTR